LAAGHDWQKEVAAEVGGFFPVCRGEQATLGKKKLDLLFEGPWGLILHA
jgi:hypothetical protein